MDKVLYKPKILIRRSAVYNAIAYRSNSDLSKSIRKVATSKYGGIKVDKYPELIEE